MCDIIFDQSAHGIFGLCQAFVPGFPSFCLFGVFASIFSRDEVKFKVYYKMEVSRFVEITDEELIEFVNQNKKIRIQRGKLGTTLSYSRISFRHQTLACLVQHPSKFIFGVSKKDGSYYEPTSLKGFFFKHLEISDQTELRVHNFYWRCVKTTATL